MRLGSAVSFAAAVLGYCPLILALPVGSVCLSSIECNTGFCVDSVCCESECAAPCAACAKAVGAPADGSCGIRKQGEPGGCFPQLCDGSSTACPTSCAAAGCQFPYICNALDGKCVGNNGIKCLSPDDCLSGHCVNGYCCSSQCGGCWSCDGAQTGYPTGECAPVLPGTDPHDACAPDPGYPGSCKGDGSCDGGGFCSDRAPLGTVCAPAKCAGNGVVQVECDALGSCSGENLLYCAPYLCQNGACSNSCITHSDCATDSWCTAGLCYAESGTGYPCKADVECSSGHCVSAICCKTACSGTARCENGQAWAADYCDGNGECRTAAAVSCGAYACGDTACKTSCASDADCGAGARCVSGKCIVQARCDGDHLVTTPSGELSDCYPFRCTSAGSCHTACSSNAQCVDDHRCNSAGSCVPRASSDDASSCQCRMNGERQTPPFALFILGVALAFGRRRVSGRPSGAC